MEKNREKSINGSGTPASGRRPMPIEQRAKQFMPFEAVTGLQAALREKERHREEGEKDK